MANEFKVGDKVVFIAECVQDHRYCPPAGTEGTILYQAGEKIWLVQWPYGTTTCEQNKGKNLAMSEWLRKVED